METSDCTRPTSAELLPHPSRFPARIRLSQFAVLLGPHGLKCRLHFLHVRPAQMAIRGGQGAKRSPTALIDADRVRRTIVAGWRAEASRRSCATSCPAEAREGDARSSPIAPVIINTNRSPLSFGTSQAPSAILAQVSDRASRLSFS